MLSRNETRALTDDWKAVWQEVQARPAPVLPQVSLMKRWHNGLRLRQQVRRWMRFVPEAAAMTEDARLAWIRSQEQSAFVLLPACMGFSHGSAMVLSHPGFMRSARDFFRMARRVVPNMAMADMAQAVRNVWIFNMLQMLLGEPVTCTPSAFAYSMLYPLTDNFLDDPEISTAMKRRFQNRFGRVIGGEDIEPDSAHEFAVFGMIHRIEEQYPRNYFPQVYEALMAIFEGQEASLAQQGDAGAEDILDISARKGGASVLADAVLVCGHLTPRQSRFAFGFGVVLQLMDDLQDRLPDQENGHHTLFSLEDGQAVFQRICALYAFSERVLQAGRSAGAEDALIRTIRHAIHLMVLSTASAQPDLERLKPVRRLMATGPVRRRDWTKLRRSGEKLMAGYGGEKKKHTDDMVFRMLERLCEEEVRASAREWPRSKASTVPH